MPGHREGVETLDIETKTQDGVKVVKMKGRLSTGPALDRFNSTLDELLSQGQYKIVLDVEEVPTIDSSGIGMLVRHLTAAKQGGGAIRQTFRMEHYTKPFDKMSRTKRRDRRFQA